MLITIAPRLIFAELRYAIIELGLGWEEGDGMGRGFGMEIWVGGGDFGWERIFHTNTHDSVFM